MYLFKDKAYIFPCTMYSDSHECLTSDSHECLASDTQECLTSDSHEYLTSDLEANINYTYSMYLACILFK